jgi:hypothetical protein
VNKLPKELTTGTVGELLVQLRFLQYNVQAAPPLKDTGNDLIAIRGQVVRAIQIKTTAKTNNFKINRQSLPALYDGLVLVQMVGSGSELCLDDCCIYLLPRSEVKKGTYSFEELEPHKLSAAAVDKFFGVAT